LKTHETATGIPTFLGSYTTGFRAANLSTDSERFIHIFQPQPVNNEQGNSLLIPGVIHKR
jgi:hypothetical protein